MAGLAYVASGRGQDKCRRNASDCKLVKDFCMLNKISVVWAILFGFIALSVPSSTALPRRIPTDIFFSHGNSKLELLLSPEDTLEMLQLLTTLDQRAKLQQDLMKQTQDNTVGTVVNGSVERKKLEPKFSRMHTTSNGNVDYEDFPEVVPFLQSNENSVLYGSPKKRYLGIDIPDYISSGGSSDAIKHMSSKLKALGKRRRK